MKSIQTVQDVSRITLGQDAVVNMKKKSKVSTRTEQVVSLLGSYTKPKGMLNCYSKHRLTVRLIIAQLQLISFAQWFIIPDPRKKISNIPKGPIPTQSIGLWTAPSAFVRFPIKGPFGLQERFLPQDGRLYWAGQSFGYERCYL